VWEAASIGVEKLDRLFNPRRIAVIGASNREGSLGAKLLRNLVGVGYKGAVYPVNPFHPIVQGITAYPTIERIPRQVDLVIVATPAHTIPQIVEECGRAGVSGVIIISAGFREAGGEGDALERRLHDLISQYDMRLIGPNCFGVMRPSISLNATFANKAATPGKIAFISQSAALCASVLDWAAEAHVGFSAVVSTGSMLDVDLGDLIDYFGTDPQTKSIVLYLESIKNARKFMSAARSFARTKPIVVVKAGKFPESAEAAVCHTGALCGEDRIYDSAFKRAGIVRVEAISDLFNCAETLAMQPNPKGSNLTIITNAGGPGIMATDHLISKGGRLSKLSNDTISALDEVLPFYCSKRNPIDVLEESNTERFEEVMKLCFKDPESDGFCVIYTPQGAAEPVETAKRIAELSKETTKPVLTAFMGEDDCWRARQLLRKKGIPAFTTPEAAVSTFMYMWGYTQNLELLYETPEELSIELTIPATLRELLRKACEEERSVLTDPEVKQFLRAYQIPTVASLTAKTLKTAQQNASKIGYPVVMKALSPRITHKSSIEGVILDVRSTAEVEEAFKTIEKRVKRHKPHVRFEGVIIQPLIRKKFELLIGAKRDPQFGSVIAFGMGGIAAELLNDVNIGFPPLNQVLARRLMDKTSIFKLLSETIPTRVDLKALEEILVKFSQLIADFPEIKEIDINPLMVDEEGAIAVDSRMLVDRNLVLDQPKSQATPKSIHDHLVISAYPKRYCSHWKLKNGKSVTLRPIKPEDETLLKKLFQSLSEQTMRFRFFQVIREVSHDTLTRYCNIDYNREIAMVAKMDCADEKRMIGVARIILQPGRKEGEFAVVVGDEWQRQGLGSKLVDYIIGIGKDMGLQKIYGDILSDNVKMIKLCEKKGFRLERVDEEMTKAILELDT